MKPTNTQLILIAVIVFLAMLACLPIALIGLEGRPQPSQDAQATQMAATLQAIMTQYAITPTPMAPTQTPIPPTATSVPPTFTPAFTATPLSYCGWIQFIKDISVPDGSAFAPGETFTKTWRLKNIGTCAWTSETKLVFINGSQLSGPSAAALPGYVGPGQTVDVSVTLTAPSESGHYTGYWMLRGADGSLFGTGVRAQSAFFVDILVKERLGHGTVTGSFCYPSEFNPPLILYFERAGTNELLQFSIPEAQPNFSVLLPNGTYYAYAWAPGYNLEGAYVNADRTMKTLVVKGGATTDGIAICDWDVSHHSRGQ